MVHRVILPRHSGKRQRIQNLKRVTDSGQARMTFLKRFLSRHHVGIEMTLSRFPSKSGMTKESSRTEVRDLLIRFLLPSVVEMTMIVLFVVSPVFALNTSFPNNKFGIHLAVPEKEDIDKAAELVNSSGGKWGYVTLVIEEDDRNHGKWQEIFNSLRKLHLIPIVRVATVPQGALWKRPVKEDADGWVSFLNSLTWPVKDQYVVLFNEPNHAAEWGGTVDARNYAEVASSFAQKLQEKNGNFFVMLAGFDASAPNGSSTQDEGSFLSQMEAAVPNLFDKIDGWASHSYPNPGFAGGPGDFGRGTVRGYEWELDYLGNLGVTKDLPVFITETGWSSDAVSPEQIGQNLTEAFVLWSGDSRVRAVTPFVLNYQGEPFLKFSWKKYLSNEFYPQFETVKKLPKVSGTPEQEEKGLITINLPKELLIDSNYHFFIPLKNEGQAIWDQRDGYMLKMESKVLQSYFLSSISDVQPQESIEVELFLKTKEDVGRGTGTLALYKNDKKIIDAGVWQFDMLPLPSLSFEAKTFPGGKAEGDQFELQIFDTDNQLVYKKRNVKVREGRATIDAVHNVYIDGRYRVVLLNPYYLPRQTHIVFGKIQNSIRFKVLLPLDFNLDGKFDGWDLLGLIKNPKLFGLFLP